MFDRFSEDARKAMSASRQAAQEFKHDYIGTEHMLLGVVASDGTVAATALRELGVDPDRVRAEVEKIVRPGPHTIQMGQLPFTPRGKRVLELALQEAQEAGHHHIGTGHLLLGLLCEAEGYAPQLLGRLGLRRNGPGIAAQVLGRLGLTLDKARPVVMDVMGRATAARDGPPTPGPTPSVSLRNLMKEAYAEATRDGRTMVEPEDVLVAMIQGEGTAARILRELGATPEGVRKRAGELRSQ
jgi:ATP-dependent Clp protease ATP-binding subunit ClpC